MSHLTHFRDNLIFLYLTLSSVTRPLHRLLRPFKAFHQQRGPFYPMMGPLPSLLPPVGEFGGGLRRLWQYLRSKWHKVLMYCSETDCHIVEIDVQGVPNDNTGQSLRVHTVRRNPSARGQVTGSATLASFLSSMLRKFRLAFSSFSYTFLSCHKPTAVEAATVTYYNRHCRTIFAVQEMTLKPCTLLISTQILQHTRELNQVVPLTC